MTIRERLLDLIRSDGRPVTQIARAAGIPQPTLASLVSGSRGQEPRAELVTRLCRELGLSPTAIGRLLLDSYPAEKESGK